MLLLLGLFSWFSPTRITRTADSCVNCGLCVSVCPVDAIIPPRTGAALTTPANRFFASTGNLWLNLGPTCGHHTSSVESEKPPIEMQGEFFSALVPNPAVAYHIIYDRYHRRPQYRAF